MRGLLEKGCEKLEIFSLIKWIRYKIEPKKAEKLGMTPDYNEAIELFIKLLENNGIFDQIYMGNESIYPLNLLYIYIDCFSDFYECLLKKQTKNNLLEILINPDYIKNNTWEILQTIIEKQNKNKILFGDIHHPFILGINFETEFNIMQVILILKI